MQAQRRTATRDPGQSVEILLKGLNQFYSRREILPLFLVAAPNNTIYKQKENRKQSGLLLKKMNTTLA